MRLEEVQITNYCSCETVRIPLDAFNPLIGYNNSGKSNVLRAVAWLLKKAVLQRHEFWDPNSAVIIEGLISNVNLALLPQNQQNQVAPFLQAGALRFRRRQEVPSAPVAQIRIEVLNPATGQWAANPTGLDTAIGVLFPEPLFIEAMEDAAEDVSKFAAKNTIGLLLKYTLDQVRNHNAQALGTVQAALLQVETLLNGAGRIQQFHDFEDNATQAIAPFFPGLSLGLQIGSPNLDDLIKSASVSLADGAGVRRPFTSFGHGAQRSVHMALIKLLATYANALNGATVVLLIDEPELYLHPQAIEILRESLKILASQGFQIVFSTHSPLLIDSDDVLQTTIVYKNAAGGTSVRQRLASAGQILTGNPHQFATVFSLQHSTYLLFSEAVLIVEGKTERMIVPVLYEVLRGHTLGYNKTCMIEATGSGSLVPTMQVLRAIGFAPKVLADLDFAFKVAPGLGLIDANSQEFQACLAWFSANSGQGFMLGTDGFPARCDQAGNAGSVDPEAAFSLMANACAAQVAVMAAQLRANDIWIWLRGSFEAHLGIQKQDVDRINFISQLKATGSVAHATDPGEISSFVNWI